MAQQVLSRPGLLELDETDQAGNLVTRYIGSRSDGSSRIDIVVPQNSKTYTKTLLAAFLPAGYPQSVTKDYIEYQIYDSLQAFSSSIAGLLSSRAVLEGVGVGDADASPTAAILLSVLQDSMGRIATILFAHKLGTSLEPECKMYRLAADVFNDAAMILDCLSPAFPKAYRVLLLSFSSVLRALCGVAAGSSKASLSAHFATQGNLGELNAKDSSQETVISLLGMLAGSLVVSHITTPLMTWSALLFLLSIHLGTNYLAVRAVSMRSLNRQRANIVLSSYLEPLSSVGVGFIQKSNTKHPEHDRILHPEEVSVRERIFERDGVLRWHGTQIIGRCALGVPLKAILDTLPLSTRNAQTGSYSYSKPDEEKVKNTASIDDILHVFQNERYILWLYPESSHLTALPLFLVVLKDGSDTKTQLKGWFHALVCARRLTRPRNGVMPPPLAILKQTLDEVNLCWDGLVTDLEEAGWLLNVGALETRPGTRVRVGTTDGEGSRSI